MLAKTPVANDTAHFHFKIGERQSALDNTSEVYGLGRSEGANVKGIDVIYIALALHTTASTGNFATTLVESKIVAVCRK